MERQKVLLAAGTAACATAVIWYLRKVGPKTLAADDVGEEDKQKRPDSDETEGTAKEQLKQILKEMIKCQEQMKSFIKELTQELGTTALSFHETCQRVKRVQPADPLESRGLKVMDFDKLLLKHQHDSDVRDAIAKIMGAPNPTNALSDKIQSISVKDIIDIHTFMLQELQQLIKEYSGSDSKETCSVAWHPLPSHLLLSPSRAANGILAAERAERFCWVEMQNCSAILHLLRRNLATDQNFAQINIKISHAMSLRPKSAQVQTSLWSAV
ncbi:unnamed protein product [Symbiodinium sp. CCMP2456]|nr:unnamed protein product [Symbiodinium sp. CCMP2456]